MKWFSKHPSQMSESMTIGLLLAMSGGFMDAYSYLERDHVFANAQTGNMLLLGVNLAEGNKALALHYLFPVCAFVIGVAVTECIRLKNINWLHWRQITVLLEALILAAVACIPLSMNVLANALTSFACGIQVESFRKIHGRGIATTMCIGNIRSGTEQLCHYVYERNSKYLRISLFYYSIILFFIAGAVIGNFCIDFAGEKAVLFCSVLLLTVFMMMFIRREKANTI